jgi:hypothetical protein
MAGTIKKRFIAETLITRSLSKDNADVQASKGWAIRTNIRFTGKPNNTEKDTGFYEVKAQMENSNAKGTRRKGGKGDLHRRRQPTVGLHRTSVKSFLAFSVFSASLRLLPFAFKSNQSNSVIKEFVSCCPRRKTGQEWLESDCVPLAFSGQNNFASPLSIP